MNDAVAFANTYNIVSSLENDDAANRSDATVLVRQGRLNSTDEPLIEVSEDS